jgi:hypothetical protein
MASILKVDTIQDQSGNNIINENADTITIGASGDTITIPSGATLSSTDPLVFPAGTVSLPAITTTGDTNTGIFFPAADTIGFAEGGAEAMRINSSGNVGIGTSSPSTKLDINGGIKFVDTMSFSDSGATVSCFFQASADIFQFGTSTSDPIVIYTNNTERMRIIGSNGQLTITTNAAGDNGMIFINANADPFGLQMDFSTASPDNNSRTFQLCEDSTTTRMIVYSDGDLANHDGVYGSISDERIKQDIRDSNSQWNDIKNIRVRNFKKKDDVRQYGDNAWEQIGVIAQELETVSPKLIKHSDPTQSDILSDSSFGTLYQEEDEIPEGKKVGDIKEVHDQIKKVSYSVLYMKSIKALQEAMERIETLEAKVTTLENK